MWHQTTTASGEAGMPPMQLTGREVPEEGVVLTEEQQEYIDRSSHAAVENIRQDIRNMQVGQTELTEILNQSEVTVHEHPTAERAVPGAEVREILQQLRHESGKRDAEGVVTPVPMTGREEVTPGMTVEEIENLEQYNQTVLQTLRQEIDNRQTRVNREGDVWHQTTAAPGEAGMPPMQLTGREVPEEGAVLTEEQQEYIDRSSHAAVENIRQDIRNMQVGQTELTEILNQSEVTVHEHPTAERAVPGAEVREILQQLRHESGKRDAEGVVTPVPMTGREEVTPGMTVEEIENLEQYNQTVLQTLRQEIDNRQTRVNREGDVWHQTTTAPGEAGMPPMQLTGRAVPEEGAVLTEEQKEYIDQSSHAAVENIRQDIRNMQVGQTELTEILNQSEVTVHEHPTAERAVPGAEVREILQQLRHESGKRDAEGVVTPVPMTGREEVTPGMTVEEIENLEQYNQTVLQTLRQEIDNRQTRVNREGDVWHQTTAVPGETETIPAKIADRAVSETLRQLRADGQEVRSEQSMPPVAMTAREAEEQAPELLVEQIERIEAHNRTLLQSMQQKVREREVILPGGPDMKRTMRDALRALEEPEQVLREVYARQEAAMVHPAFTPEEENVLQRVDPASRAVYEQILAYQKDPEGTLAKGVLKPVSMGAFQAEIRQAMQEMPLELEHQPLEAQQQKELIREQSEIILEKFHRMPGQRVWEELPRQPAAVHIVHKAVAPDVTEELLEQLEQTRTQSTTTTVSKDEVTHSQTHQVDIKQIEQKVVTQTTEDITELVNRTLARQMRTISDQVYRQMEKRLQSERNRRGRF